MKRAIAAARSKPGVKAVACVEDSVMVIDSVPAAIERIRSGRGARSDFFMVHNYLEGPDSNLSKIHDAISCYLKYSQDIDWNLAVKYVNYPDDPMISAVTITMAAIGQCPDERFWDEVAKIAKGVDWDPQNNARVRALLALHMRPGGCPQAREIVRHNLMSDSESVRDSAAVAAQRCFGRSEADVIAHSVSGRLIESVGSDVLNWIWPEREANQRPR